MSTQNTKQKIVITVAPVCHVEKTVPEGPINPITPEAIAEEVANCAKAGASQVHLHTRDEIGRQTIELDVFSKTLDLIRKESDIVIQGSTGGLADISLEERCVCLNEPKVEVASLNMGSVNFGETVYINTRPDIRFWAQRMHEKKVVPELECFDLNHVQTCGQMADEGVLDRPMHYNFCLGAGIASNLAANGQNILYMKSLTESGSHWGLTYDSMPDFSMLLTAISMGASVLRIGFEDSFFYAPGKMAKTNAELVERLATMITDLGYELATPTEARELLGINKLR